MRRLGHAAVLCMAYVAMPSAAFAQPLASDTAATTPDDPRVRLSQRIGYGAMPGGLHVATAEALPQGTVELAALSGFGYRKGLLGADHTFERAIGDLALAYAPLPDLVLGLSLDGRYDTHKGLPAMTGDGYVGDPHVLVRYVAPLGRIALGGQLGVWVPGQGAPSLAVSATSVDARGLLSIDAGFGTLSIDVGFRIDNSAKLVDAPDTLSVEHRVSLGVSDFHAALGGVALRVPAGDRLYVALEGSTDVFVGKGAPGPILRGGGLIGVAVSDTVTIVGYVEVAKVPSLDYSDVMAGHVVLIPYEPTVTGGLGLQARFSGPRRVAAVSQIVKPPRPVSVVVETAEVSGIVVDDSGNPIVGAKIAIRLKDHTGTTITDDQGGYTIAKLPIGKTVDGKTESDDTVAEIVVEAANKKSGSASLTLARGRNVVPTIALDPMLPPGQLRAVIINIGTSRPVADAIVTIQPGGATATSGPDGKFTVDLPPGQYKITVTAKGLAEQQLDVTIEQNGVAIKNIDMHK